MGQISKISPYLLGIPQSVLTISQVLMYNTTIRRRENSSVSTPKHSRERETPPPILLGTLILSYNNQRNYNYYKKGHLKKMGGSYNVHALVSSVKHSCSAACDSVEDNNFPQKYYKDLKLVANRQQLK